MRLVGEPGLNGEATKRPRVAREVRRVVVPVGGRKEAATLRGRVDGPWFPEAAQSSGCAAR